MRSILRDRGAAIATANLIEVLDVTQRVRGIPIERVRAVIDPLLDETVAIVALDLAIARRAAGLHATHYNLGGGAALRSGKHLRFALPGGRFMAAFGVSVTCLS